MPGSARSRMTKSTSWRDVHWMADSPSPTASTTKPSACRPAVRKRAIRGSSSTTRMRMGGCFSRTLGDVAAHGRYLSFYHGVRVGGPLDDRAVMWSNLHTVHVYGSAHAVPRSHDPRRRAARD